MKSQNTSQTDSSTENTFIVRGFDRVLSIDAIVGDHAYKSRRAGFTDISDRLLDVQSKAIDAQKRVHQGDVERAQLTVEFDADDADLIRESCEYVVEGHTDLSDDVVADARTLYTRLGGTLPENRDRSEYLAYDGGDA